MDRVGQLAVVGTLEQMVGVSSIPFRGAGYYRQCSYDENGCRSYRIKPNGNLEESEDGVTYTGDIPCAWYSVGGARCTTSAATWDITSAGIQFGDRFFSWLP